jgi:trehalose 6-phosphate synthase/phosphatase
MVVVSARAPFVDGAGGTTRGPGGVVSALLPLLRRTRGAWFATGAGDEASLASEPSFQVHAIALDGERRAEWYGGACNGALWPLAHGLLDRCRFTRAAFGAYADVNRAVAEAVAAGAGPEATVWVHDYQLALVPALLRERRPDLRIGFFWHLPWPAADLLRALPWAEDLVRGVLGADLVGLHVPRYVRAFEDALAELGLPCARRAGDAIETRLDGRPVRVRACPIGIDVQHWAALAEHPAIAGDGRELRRAFGDVRVLLAVDRLDYTKGIVERLEAFERALDADVSIRDAATLVQLGVPSREQLGAYRDLRARVEATVGRINGRFATATRVPVRFFATCLSSRELAPYYLAADVALVTPMRDGMNLVAFEYVASRPDRSGRLVLSSTAGAADLLREAYLVNPYDEDGLTAALVRAATFPETAVDAARMGALKARVSDLRADGWIDRFLAELDAGARGSGAVGGRRLREAG